jgi:hypothetical protein
MIASTATHRSALLSAATMRPAANLRRPRGDFRYFVDRSGCQHFNFPQRIWLDPTIAMAVTPVQTIALETLAINLLSFMTRERDYRAAVGVTSQRAIALAREFCAECLLGAPAEAWELPRASIKAWLESHQPAGRIKHRCARRPRQGGPR